MRIRNAAILGLGLLMLWAPACAEKPGKKKDDPADKAKAKDAKKDAKAKADAKKDESPDPEAEPD
jgi:hypothetical protein